jgi:UDP-N-acetylglucosamine diphosphorylase / glucose-1-phosphate thymidylyltransferase / UDP-N-acetylgalactosamine diphosphorylase / glucosamine-1-phosphate N-acetyltransferase / galactosamine-1-phosphate N-acetyltransferase
VLPLFQGQFSLTVIITLIAVFLQSSNFNQLMQIILFDSETRAAFYPFSLVRPVSAFRCGIFTAQERWTFVLQQDVFTLTEDYLAEAYPFADSTAEDFLYINASAIFSNEWATEVKALPPETVLLRNNSPVAVHTKKRLTFPVTNEQVKHCTKTELSTAVRFLHYPYDLVLANDLLIRTDIELIGAKKISASISSTNQVINPEQIFIEEGAEVEYCTLNASTGPIYIGKHALLMEGTMIRGPFAALDNSVLKMGSKIYGATTVGKKCTIGGEIKNSIFFDYSNKAHDGYLGDAVIGSWCNIGAGASCSNVKNTAGEVKLWNPLLHQWISAGTKCGVMLGDYSKVSINASLTTGMVSGICSNILPTGLSPKFVADFTWNIHTGEKYLLPKALLDIENWMQMKQQTLTNNDKQILEYIYSILIHEGERTSKS